MISLAKMIWMVIETRKIKKTDLYRDIKNWQIENSEWKILNDDLQ